MKLTKKLYLTAPNDYWELSQEEKKIICNGCGPGKIGSWFVPNTLWGLSVRESCNIHDYMYKIGKTEQDKDLADLVFYNNMQKTVRHESQWIWLQRLRLRRAWKYFLAVHELGNAAFYKGKR